MKKWVCIALALLTALSMAACGKQEAAVVPTETETAQVTEQENAASEEGNEFEQRLNVPEARTVTFDNNADYENLAHVLGFPEVDTASGPSGAEGSRVKSMTYTDEAFRLEFESNDYDFATSTSHFVGWTMYAFKGTELTNLCPYHFADYENVDSAPLRFDTKGYEAVCYTLYDPTDNTVAAEELYYYPNTGNVYNVFTHWDEVPETISPTYILSWEPQDPLVNGEMLEYKGNTYVMADFSIAYGDQVESYRYRVGMSLANWAMSDLNTSGWILTYENTLVSPDYKYCIEDAEQDIQALSNGQAICAKQHIQEGSKVFVSDEEVDGMLDSTKTTAAFAHLVNYKTPLLPVGFRMSGNQEQNHGWEQMFDIGRSYSMDDTIHVYMPNIPDELLPHIKMYVMKDSQAYLDAIRGGLRGHLLPFDPETDRDALTIPEDADVVPFTHVSEEEARENGLYIDYVEAVYNVAQGNLARNGENAFAITYDDEVVFWIHMPAFTA